jgi:hypothetical protein
MNHPSLAILAALGCAGIGCTQAVVPAGAAVRAAANAYTRGGIGMNGGELLQRFDAALLQGYGVETSANAFVVRGLFVQMRDFGASVPNGLVDVTLYTEDPLRPHYPDLGSPLGSVAGVTPGGIALTYTAVLFPAPIFVPPGRDLFVGIRLNPTTSPVGGTRLNLNLLSGVAGSIGYDLAGAGLPTSPPEANSFRLFRDASNQLTYQARGQYLMDLLTLAPGGFPTALTNQPNYGISGTPPGTTTLLSGLHPDVRSPPANAGRADDVGFVYLDPHMPAGMPVAFLASFGGFGPIVPLSTVVPGSVGGSCLDSASSAVLGFAMLDQYREAYYMTPVPAAARPLLPGLSWAQQAIGFDTNACVLRGTQCGRQRF